MTEYLAACCEDVYYVRPNRKTGRYSKYIIVPAADAEQMDVLCAAVFRRTVRVQKKRRLYLFKNARIHLDEVKGAGTFLEFEVIVRYGKRQARTLLKYLIDRFDIPHASRVAVSYSDLLMRRKKKGGKKN